MVEQKLVLGIKIKFTPVGNFGLRADFSIGLGVSSPDFLTNREIREEISKLKAPEGQRVGKMDAIVNPSANTLYWQNYHPTINLSHDLGKAAFVRKGLAQLLEYRFLTIANRLYF